MDLGTREPVASYPIILLVSRLGRSSVGAAFILLYLWDDHGEILFASAIAVFVGAGALAIGFHNAAATASRPKTRKKNGPGIAESVRPELSITEDAIDRTKPHYRAEHLLDTPCSFPRHFEEAASIPPPDLIAGTIG